MGHDVSRSVSKMLAFAFNHHRAGISNSPMLLREAFVEECIDYACRSTVQGQVFIDALLPDGNVRTFKGLSRQPVDDQIPGSRPDLEIQYSDGSFSEQDPVIRVELKIDAALTPAQRKAGYARKYLCPSRRVPEISRELGNAGASVVSWTELLESIRAAASSLDVDIPLWEMICSLGEELGDTASLFAAPAILRDERVAQHYSRALILISEIIETLGHKPLFPPERHMGANHREIGFGSRNDASLLFTPAYVESPIAVRYEDVSANRQKWFWPIHEFGASQTYDNNGTTVVLPLEDTQQSSDSVYFKEELLQLSWGPDASDAGEYLSDFLFVVRSLAKVNPDITLTLVPLTNQNVGYILRRDDVEFYALFDARCWLQSPKDGPFVMYDNADSPVAEAVYMLTGSEATHDDFRKSIRQKLRSRLGLPDDMDVQGNGSEIATDSTGYE
ncbi:hypothetical protein ABIB17_000474 [Arthrobacter sp. UYEF6]